MKKIIALSAIGIVACCIALGMVSCTENQRARRWGGTETIKVPKNNVIVTAMFKDSDLWIMSKDTTTNEIKLWEKSNWGVNEGTIKFEYEK